MPRRLRRDAGLWPPKASKAASLPPSSWTSGAQGRWLLGCVTVNTKLLIDAIVRQTTVLIAQLSTAAGIRAPLAHVADQVFVELSRELEAQGHWAER